MKLYEIKIQLLNITKPPIWRTVRVASTYTFENLHEVVQRSMGWMDCHLHQFIIGDPYRGMGTIIVPEEELEEMASHVNKPLDEAKVTLDKFLKKPKDKLKYEYDFGDGWEHSITLEKVVDFDANLPCPFILKGKGACPPEDCGGPWGFGELKAAFEKPKSKAAKELREWLGYDFDPNDFDIDDLNDDLEFCVEEGAKIDAGGKIINFNFGDEEDEDDEEFDEEEMMEFVEDQLQQFVENRQPDKILVNLSNHPKDSWSKEQLNAAKKMFGKVVDIPFPNIAPTLDREGIVELLIEYSKKVMEFNPMAVHVMGEMTFTAAFVMGMQNFGVACYASTSERNVVMTKDGKKEVTFDFVQFREYL